MRDKNGLTEEERDALKKNYQHMFVFSVIALVFSINFFGDYTLGNQVDENKIALNKISETVKVLTGDVAPIPSLVAIREEKRSEEGGNRIYIDKHGNLKLRESKFPVENSVRFE